MEAKTNCFKVAGKDRPLHHGHLPPCSTKSTRPRPFVIFFPRIFPDLWMTSPLHVMTWHINDDVAVVWTSTALRANRYSCTLLVWAEWVRAHGGWRKDGFGRELHPKNCTTGKSIPVCGLTELAGDFSVLRFWSHLTIRSLMYMYVCMLYST